jgi:hypothetical protein
MNKITLKRNLQVILILLCIALSIPYTANAEESYQVIMTLESPEPESGAGFGSSIVFNENFILVGESSATVDGHRNAGKAHLFDWDGNLILSLHAPTPQESG